MLLLYISVTTFKSKAFRLDLPYKIFHFITKKLNMKLLQPALIGSRLLKNRMIMAAMTRSRSGVDGLVNELTKKYYTQRAGAGLIISEGVNISEQAIGSPFTPGIFNKNQIEAWKAVTKAIHEEGGLIFAQLWHTGRVGHSTDRKGNIPVAPSAIAIEGLKHFTSEGLKEYEIPKELTREEIKTIVKDYRQAALNAFEAGFDGVQLHAANGYLPNQFLAESVNKRKDEYGGSIENNSRFILEIMKELIEVAGGERVSIKISPLNPYNEISLNNPIETYSYLLQEIDKMDIAFIELSKKGLMFPLLSHYPKEDEIELFGRMTRHTIVANGGYTRESAEAELEKGIAKFISFGVNFLSNPDLPKRFEKDFVLNEADTASFFGGNEKGYTDYAFMS